MKPDFVKLDRAFNPQCVVVVGDKDRLFWLRAQSTFKGQLYSVQVDLEVIKRIEALGIKNYRSILDIPDPIDLAIVAVPRTVALSILEDCICKEVAAAHFFTAGFAETEAEEGRKLEQLLAERANQADFHLIGPNCMGIFNPKIGLRQAEHQYAGFVGPVGLISQSGTHAVAFAHEAHLQGIDINKSVSFGNGTVLDSADYLDYFGRDSEISVIGMYLEGVKDARRFFTVLKEVSAYKSVVVWKGGRTDAGERAIASHTGALAMPRAIWDAAIRQCGALNVANMEELIDTLKALLYLPPVRGNRVGVVGMSGGQSVAVADAFAEAGLSLPLLSQESYDELATFWTLIGGGYRNPIDIGNVNRKEMRRIVDILEGDTNTDNLVLLMQLSPDSHTYRHLQSDIDAVVNVRRRTLKPVMAIVSWYFSPEAIQQSGDILQRLQTGGIPVFVSLERGARALRNTLEYYRIKGSVNT